MAADPDFLANLTIRQLDRSIDTSRFEGHEQIVWYLREAAQDYQDRRFSVATCWLCGTDLAGYITTSMSIVDLEESSQRGRVQVEGVRYMRDASGAKRFPALLIGMLGVCAKYEGKGLGKEMIRYAIGQAVELSKGTGCRFVTVDSVLTDRAIGMYSSLGFERVDAQKKRRTVWMFYDLGRTT